MLPAAPPARVATPAAAGSLDEPSATDPGCGDRSPADQGKPVARDRSFPPGRHPPRPMVRARALRPRFRFIGGDGGFRVSGLRRPWRRHPVACKPVTGTWSSREARDASAYACQGKASARARSGATASAGKTAAFLGGESSVAHKRSTRHAQVFAPRGARCAGVVIDADDFPQSICRLGQLLRTIRNEAIVLASAKPIAVQRCRYSRICRAKPDGKPS